MSATVRKSSAFRALPGILFFGLIDVGQLPVECGVMQRDIRSLAVASTWGNGGGRWIGCFSFCSRPLSGEGTFRVTTSRGTVFTFGDGTGQPVSVRFASRAAEWGILLDPELKFGESYMNGTFVVEQGSIADVLAICLGQKSDVPHWARPQRLAALPAPAFEPVQSAPARAPQRGASLRSRRPALFAVPRRRPAIQLRLFRKSRPVARRRAAGQEAAPRRQAAARPTIARARHRLRLGRARACISPKSPAPT